MKLTDTSLHTPIPTEIEGLYLRSDLTFEQIAEIEADAKKFKRALDKPQTKSSRTTEMDFAHKMFHLLARDEHGEEFEDALTIEQVQKLPFMVVTKGVKALMHALGNEAGGQQPAA